MSASERETAASLRSARGLLRRNKDYRRLFVASVISLGGDWFLYVAIGGLVLDATHRATSIGVMIVAQELPFFFATPFAGWLADHLDRRKLMIACDLARALICLGFLMVGPANLWLAYVLLGVLSLFAAVFDPASSAAVPNVVEPEDLATANATFGSLWGTMLAVGAALGGIVSTVFGNDTAFIVDAVSFVVSAGLLASISRPFSEERTDAKRPGLLETTMETIRYARRDRQVRALISVKFGFGLAAGVFALIAVFGKEVFAAGNLGFGMLMAARGVGALVGPFLGHRLSGPNHSHLFRAVAIALATFGLGYVLMGVTPTLALGMVAIFIAHLGGGSQWALSSYGLQRLVPDHIRGRIFAVDFALITLSLGLSSLITGALADVIGPRPAVMIVGGLAFAWSGVWWLLTAKTRRAPLFDGRDEEPDTIATVTRAVE